MPVSEAAQRVQRAKDAGRNVKKTEDDLMKRFLIIPVAAANKYLVDAGFSHLFDLAFEVLGVYDGDVLLLKPVQ